MIWSVLQKSPACRQPLFLKVLFEEAKLWRSYDADVRLNEPEMSNDYVSSVADICNVGDKMKVKVIAVDEQDRVKLSRRAAMEELGEPVETTA